MLPTEPIDSTDPLLAMLRTESSDAMDHLDAIASVCRCVSKTTGGSRLTPREAARCQRAAQAASMTTRRCHPAPVDKDTGMYVTLIDGARLWFDVLAPEAQVLGDRVVLRPTLIGIHGGPGIDSTSMISVLAPLADVAQLVRYDQRGHGHSDRGLPDEWTMERWADDLAELIRALGVADPLLLGTSFGARVALTTAIRHPGLVGGVVAAYGGARLDEAATVEAFRRLGGDQAARVAAGDPDDPATSFEEWLRVCWPLVSRTPQGSDHQALMQRLSARSPELHQAHLAKDLERHPVPDLDLVTCPVLVLGGDDDPLMPPTLMTELAQALSGSRRVEHVTVPGAGHTVFLDCPDVAYPAVRRFIDNTWLSAVRVGERPRPN